MVEQRSEAPVLRLVAVAVVLAVGLLGFAWLREPSLTVAVVGLVAVVLLLRTATRSARRLSWGLLAAGTALWLSADVATRVLDPDHAAAASLSWRDVLYVAGQAVLAAGLLSLGGRSRRLGTAVDAVIMFVAGTALAWYFLVVRL